MQSYIVCPAANPFPLNVWPATRLRTHTLDYRNIVGVCTLGKMSTVCESWEVALYSHYGVMKVMSLPALHEARESGRHTETTERINKVKKKTVRNGPQKTSYEHLHVPTTSEQTKAQRASLGRLKLFKLCGPVFAARQELSLTVPSRPLNVNSGELAPKKRLYIVPIIWPVFVYLRVRRIKCFIVNRCILAKSVIHV